jgi:hypothetical protein
MRWILERPQTMQKIIVFLFLMQMGCSFLNADVVWAFYKGAEGTTEQDNEVRWHLQTTLESLHLDVIYKNIDEGWPANVPADLKGVITWFRGPEMLNAKAYIEGLKDLSEKGVRIVICGNFGAYQDKKTLTWLSYDEVNVFFHQLGLEYKGQWTQNQRLLRTQQLHTSMASAVNFPEFKSPTYYLQFSLVDAGVTALATIERTDLKDGASVVLSVSNRGGIALHPYICYQPSPGAPFVYAFDRRRFLQLALLMVDKTQAKTALCLYKGSENQTESENEIHWHVEPILRQHELECEYVDISKGLPDNNMSQQAKIIVTWFRSSEMKMAEGYLEWLTHCVNEGTKVFIFGNMGAYTTSIEESKWLSSGKINNFYKAIGLEYSGQWTNRTELIDYKFAEEQFFHLNMKDLVTRSHFYQGIKLINPMGRSLLKISRSDIVDSASDVIVITPNGAYAEGAYIFWNGNKGLVPVLKIDEFIKAACP